MWNLKYDRNEPMYVRNGNRLTDIEKRLVDAKGEGVGEGWTGNLELTEANYYI